MLHTFLNVAVQRVIWSPETAGSKRGQRTPIATVLNSTTFPRPWEHDKMAPALPGESWTHIFLIIVPLDHAL